MEAMRAAFYRVCDILQLSGDREDPVLAQFETPVLNVSSALVSRAPETVPRERREKASAA
jgi:hypothetical protein